MKKKLILVALVLIFAGIFLAKYTKRLNFTVVDTQSGKNGAGVLNVGAIFTGSHNGFIEIEGRKYVGKCTMAPTESYKYEGDCRFDSKKSYFNCAINAAVESTEHRLNGECEDENGIRYSFL